ncbi:hypothetical protein Tco_0926706 [Tanacetum coccineum]|uniref:Xylulose kinase-1 n=1 Tax=Tanacetum coccineum TaxID=301880 RepID=A0ABQ5DD83_9ASTR
MAALKFASSHNMVAFLDKPTESDGFKQIVDFLNAHPIKYALTVNPTIYTACIAQFWATAKVKIINKEVQIQALVDKKKVIITETSVRSDLQLEDAEGTECLQNATIFEQLTLMGRKQRNDTEDPQLSGPTEPVTDDTENVASVPTHSNDPLLSDSKRYEFTKLKEKVKKLEKKGESRTHMLRRLYKVGRSLRVFSSEDEGLGDQEDGRYGDNLMFDTSVLDNEQDMAKKKVDMAEKDVSTADPVTTANVVVSTAEVTTDSTTTTTKMRSLQTKGEEDANIAEWEDVQAMMDADYELAARLQAEEQRELTIKEKSRLFMELMNKRKKHFARLRAEEQEGKTHQLRLKRNTKVLLF